MLTAGKWVTTDTFTDVVNPYDHSVLDKVPVASGAEVADFLNAAEAGAGVFTSDFSRAFQAAEELEVGAVYINDSATFRVDHQPYGGVRNSGLGREGPKFAIQEMTEIRFISFNLD